MSADVQTYLAWLVVVMAAAGLIWRTVAKRNKPGCGGGCGCPTDELKAKSRR